MSIIIIYVTIIIIIIIKTGDNVAHFHAELFQVLTVWW